MTKKIVLSLFAALALGLSSGYSQALVFDIINQTGYDLYGVYVSPNEEENWGNDLIPEDTFTNNSSVTVSIPEDYGETCDFDIKVTINAEQSDDEAIFFTKADLCRIVSISLHNDGTYTVVWED